VLPENQLAVNHQREAHLIPEYPRFPAALSVELSVGRCHYVPSLHEGIYFAAARGARMRETIVEMQWRNSHSQ